MPNSFWGGWDQSNLDPAMMQGPGPQPAYQPPGQQMDPASLMKLLDLTPEQQQAIVQGHAAERESQVQNARLQQAMALQNQQGQNYSTGPGAALGGLGDVLRQITGARMANSIEGKQAELAKQIQAGQEASTAHQSAGQRFQALMGLQKETAEEKYKRDQLDVERQKLEQGRVTGIAPAQDVVDSRTGAILRKGIPEPKNARGLTAGQQQEELQNFKKDIGTASARGKLTGPLQMKLFAAEQLGQLILGEGGDIKDLMPQQVREAAMSLGNLVSNGGSNAVSNIEELVPHTLAGQWATLKQKVLNEPQGAEAQAFLKNMLETAQRESKLVHRQMRSLQIQALPIYAHLAKSDPVTYRSALEGAGLNPDDFDPTTGLPLKKTEPFSFTPRAAPVQIKNDAEWEALAPGTEFTDPEGVKRTK